MTFFKCPLRLGTEVDVFRATVAQKVLVGSYCASWEKERRSEEI